MVDDRPEKKANTAADIVGGERSSPENLYTALEATKRHRICTEQERSSRGTHQDQGWRR